MMATWDDTDSSSSKKSDSEDMSIFALMTTSSEVTKCSSSCPLDFDELFDIYQELSHDYKNQYSKINVL